MTKKEAATTNGVDVSEINIDLGSFVHSERRYLQERFDTDFEDLLLYVEDKLNRTQVKLAEGFGRELKPPPIKILGADGRSVFADDILIAMATVVRQRSEPDATEEDLADVTYLEMVSMVRAPKAPTPSNSSTDKTSS